MKKKDVFINEFGVIEIVVHGDQTTNSVHLLSDKAEVLAKKLRKSGKPVLMLDNLFNIGKTSFETRKVVVERVRATDCDKFAFVSNDRLIRFGAGLILRAINRGDTMKFFENYDEANAWLTS